MYIRHATFVVSNQCVYSFGSFCPNIAESFDNYWEWILSVVTHRCHISNRWEYSPQKQK